jgi:hypothetical protein
MNNIINNSKEDMMDMSWSFWEPVLGWFGAILELMALGSAVGYYGRLKLAERRRAQLATQGEYCVLTLSVGQPVKQAVKKSGVNVDKDINPEEVLGHLIIDGVRDYKILLGEARAFIKENQNKEVRIYSSAPPAFNGLLGQSMGAGFDLVFYQFDLATGKYSPAPPLQALL